MNLRNLEIFRSWLIRQLEPICKANPEPVSNYVCILLKKNNNYGELKHDLIDQLYVFLHSVTEEFVNFLIDVLESEKYLTNNAEFHLSEASDTAKENDVVKKLSENKDEFKSMLAAEKKSHSPILAPTPSPPKQSLFQKSSPPRSRRNCFRTERPRRSLVCNRKNRRDSSHSDSPPLKDFRIMPRKRSASGSSGSSTKSPRRSWIVSRSSDTKKYKRRNFNTRPPTTTIQKSRSTSPKIRVRKPSKGSSRKRSHAPSSYNSDDDHNHSSKRLPLYQDVKPVLDSPLQPATFDQKQRCLDFEGKGYCAQGDMCPYDHGPSPIVLDSNILNGIVPLPPPPPPAAPAHVNQFSEPNLYTPQFVKPSLFPAMPAVTNRELISVPTLPHPQNTKGKTSYGHIFSSLPPGISQTTIEITNLPTEKNNIPDLYQDFCSFGNLTLVQCKRNRDAGKAILMYTNATEAALAFINIATVIPNAKAAWYADKCILKPYPHKSIPGTKNQNNVIKSYVLKRGNPVNDVNKVAPAPQNNDVARPSLGDKPQIRHQDAGRLLYDLIKMKRGLLEKQLLSRKEIQEKIKSLEAGSLEWKTCQDMLDKLKERIKESEKSIEESLQQRKVYLQKMDIVPMDSDTLNNLKRNETATDEERKIEPGGGTVIELTVQEEKEDTSPVKSCNRDKEGAEYTRVVVSGFENGDEEELIEHFSQFGKILDKEIDNTIPSATLIYDNRKSAEMAKKEGRIFQDRLMTVTVYGSKKFMPSLRRTPAFKAQEYVAPFNQYSNSGNPYKYMNPQIVNSNTTVQAAKAAPVATSAAVAVVPTVVSRNVYTYRAEQKSKLTKMANEGAHVGGCSTIKLTDEEDLKMFLQGSINAKELEKYKN